MADIIQFSKARKDAKEDRKRRERAEKEARAASNRVRFGRIPLKNSAIAVAWARVIQSSDRFAED
ncbi:DUF4169 family protein, partial [Parvibaculum sedimenti]|uniref:DUF4169 family protein n=1 Tax=Parvibaculum sedimenti TaxID=2608632 RepID=UPI001639A80E